MLISACNGDVAETPSVTVPTRAPPADERPAAIAESTESTPTVSAVAAAPRPASTSVPMAPAAPARTPTPSSATPAATTAPDNPPPTAPPPPSPSPTAPPAASPSPSPDPTTPPATASPTATAGTVAPSSPTPTRAPTPLRANIGRIATALSVDGLQRPQDVSETFGLDDRIYISVEFRDVREGARLGFRWSSGSCGGEYETGPQQPLRRGYFAFYVDETNCVGKHSVAITVDGAVAAETSFMVVDQPSVAR